MTHDKKLKNIVILKSVIGIFFLSFILLYISYSSAQVPEDEPNPQIFVTGHGEQFGSINITENNYEFELGGVISILLKDSPDTIVMTSIKFAEIGTLANEKFNNITVEYVELEDDAECSTSTPQNPSTFGEVENFDEGSNTITVNSLPYTLENGRRNCFYLKYSVDYDDYQNNKRDYIGKSVKFTINNQSDIITDSVNTQITFGDEQRVELSGNTIISELGVSTLALKKNNQNIVFFVDEGVLYKSVDNINYRMSPSKIYVHDMSFKNMSPAGQIPLIEINLVLSNADKDRNPYGRFQYFKTTVQMNK